jgi:hypothetical protein
VANWTSVGGWTISTVDNSSDVGQFTSIGINSLGNIYISYYNVTGEDLKVANNLEIPEFPTIILPICLTLIFIPILIHKRRKDKGVEGQ